MQNKKQAFTLVELIVVITILAILGTIAFISLQGYSASSRDSVRISDVSNMKTSLELFHLDAGKYPIPDNAEEITYGTEILWYQGTLGETVVSQLSRNLNKIPKDPLIDKEYIFSTSGNRNEFQILNLLEGDLSLNIISQTNAATSVRTPRVDGQYNGLFIKTANYIFPTPSLITSEPITSLAGLVLNPNNIKSQVTTGGKNIPNTGNINTATGKLNIKLSVYSGATITTNSSDADKILAMQAIQGAYTGSELANYDVYKLILNTVDNDLAALVDTVILNKTNNVTTIADIDAPIGGDFTIDEGTTTGTDTINLTITCGTDVSNPVEMFLSGDVTGEDSWITCTNTKLITLTIGDAIKNVTMKFRDSNLNETSIISKSVQLSTVLPLYGSCREILTNTPSKLYQDGVYTIDPENNGTGFDVYCDMTTDGGGWTLIFKINLGLGSDCYNNNLGCNVNNLTNLTLATGGGRLSNNILNILSQNTNAVIKILRSDKTTTDWYNRVYQETWPSSLQMTSSTNDFLLRVFTSYNDAENNTNGTLVSGYFNGTQYFPSGYPTYGQRFGYSTYSSENGMRYDIAGTGAIGSQGYIFIK